MRQEKITYLRHTNGRGKLLGDSDVSKSAHLDRTSIASESAVIRDSVVVDGSRIVGEARVLGGSVIHSYVGGKCSVSGDSLVRNAVITDNAQVYERARVVGDSLIVVSGSARVYGDAYLKGTFALYGRMRVNTGIWNRAPRFVELGFEAVTESKIGAMVGCRDRTREYWLEHGPKLAVRWGMTSEMIAQLIEAVKEVTSERT